MLNIITNGYVLPFISKPKLARAPLIQSGYKAHQKDLALASLYPVSSIKERNRNSGKCKILRVLQSPVFSPQASPKVETSDRPGSWKGRGNQYIQLVKVLCCKLPTNGKQLPAFPLEAVPGTELRPQRWEASVTDLGLYNDCKGSEADGPDKGNQTSPIPRRLAYQGPVSERSPSEHSESGKPDTGWIINQEKSELKPTQVFLFIGYEYHLDSALVKPTQERWLKLQDMILRLKSKHVLTARCLC